MAAYPEDRIRDRRTSLRLIATAVKAGVTPDDLLLAVKAYAKESEGYTRSKVCFSDNWFKMRRWEKGLAQIQADREWHERLKPGGALVWSNGSSDATLCANTSPTAS